VARQAAQATESCALWSDSSMPSSQQQPQQQQPHKAEAGRGGHAYQVRMS
jgi:hypothetical protein